MMSILYNITPFKSDNVNTYELNKNMTEHFYTKFGIIDLSTKYSDVGCDLYCFKNSIIITTLSLILFNPYFSFNTDGNFLTISQECPSFSVYVSRSKFTFNGLSDVTCPI